MFFSPLPPLLLVGFTLQSRLQLLLLFSVTLSLSLLHYFRPQLLSINYELSINSLFFFNLNFVFVIRRLGQPRRAARKFQLIRQRSRSQRGKANAQKLSLQKARTHDATSQSAAMLGINSVRTVNSANREPVAVIAGAAAVAASANVASPSCAL